MKIRIFTLNPMHQIKTIFNYNQILYFHNFSFLYYFTCFYKLEKLFYFFLLLHVQL